MAGMEITLLVSDALAVELTSAATPGAGVLGATLQRRHAHVRPLAPGSGDPQLRRYFIVDAEDAAAEELRRELGAIAGVEAAYIKPPDAPP